MALCGLSTSHTRCHSKQQLAGKRMEIKPVYSGALQLLVQKVTKTAVRWGIEIYESACRVQMNFLLSTERREQDSLPLLQLLASRGV